MQPAVSFNSESRWVAGRGVQLAVEWGGVARQRRGAAQWRGCGT